MEKSSSIFFSYAIKATCDRIRQWTQGWFVRGLGSLTHRRHGWPPLKNKIQLGRGSHVNPQEHTTANYGQNGVTVSQMSKCFSFWGLHPPEPLLWHGLHPTQDFWVTSLPLPSTLRKNFSNPALSEVNQKSRKSVKMFLRYRQPNLVAYYFGPPGRYREIDNLTFNKYN